MPAASLPVHRGLNLFLMPLIASLKDSCLLLRRPQETLQISKWTLNASMIVAVGYPDKEGTQILHAPPNL